MSPLSALLLVLTIVGCLYTVSAMLCLVFYGRRPTMMPSSFPPVTILKPLHGDEPFLFETLSSFVGQDYPGPIQVIFGASERTDPALNVVRRLEQVFPAADLHTVVDARQHGRNGKVSNLVNMGESITGDVVVLADSDILVKPDYLRRVVGALQEPGVGGVTCLYRGVSLSNLWSRLATGSVDGHFLPNVVLGTTLGLANPCMGSTIAFRRHTLDRIGGFQAVKDHLADDYEIGAAIRRLGLTVAVPPNPVVGHTSAVTSLKALLRQELRWARTIRTVDFGGFAGSIVTHVLPFALLTALADGCRARDGLPVLAALALRAALYLQVKRFVRKDTADLSLLPLRDLLSFAVFLGSFLPGSIDWRGHRFGVRSDGILTAPDSTGP